MQQYLQRPQDGLPIIRVRAIRTLFGNIFWHFAWRANQGDRRAEVPGFWSNAKTCGTTKAPRTRRNCLSLCGFVPLWSENPRFRWVCSVKQRVPEPGIFFKLIQRICILGVLGDLVVRTHFGPQAKGTTYCVGGSFKNKKSSRPASRVGGRLNLPCGTSQRWAAP